MSSILTNTAAMTALQSLRGVNNDLGTVQNQISTGLAVGSAKDNASSWAISQVMSSDVSGFESISESLSLGQSTVGVARDGAESVTELLNEMKGRVVAAQQENVDRDKIQNEIDQLKGQVESVVGTAQFNGLNLLNGKAGDVNVLSSLDRAADQSVSSNSISVAAQDLTFTALDVDGDATVTGDGAADVTDPLSAANFFAEADGTDGGATAISREALDDPDNPPEGALIAGDTVSVSISGPDGDVRASYTIGEGDDADAVAAGLNGALDAPDGVTIVENGGALELQVDDSAPNDGVEFTASLESSRGGLGDLAGLDVTTQEGARAALDDIEGLIQTSIDTAADLGATERRMEIQQDFMSSLMDGLDKGIGALVDADMEEASARLQALQVQQQLATQSLGIANQGPQNLLSLFG